MEIIDLRSDTVTQPTTEMRAAMAKAEVGDDVYGEDPTINHLQELAAEKLAKEAALFVPSGTMGNLLAVLTHCQRGDEAIMGDKGHTFLFEGGGISALGGIFAHTLPNQTDGTLDLEEIKGAIRPDDVHQPHSSLLILENTQNRCGGVILTADYTAKAARLAYERGMKLHLDGARIFNAAIASNCDVSALTTNVDSVTFCLSKGLCAPVGSVLCGTRDFIQRAKHLRKMLGGGMRQAGILAAAGIVAIENMVERLSEDHRRAKALAEGLGLIKGLQFDMGFPQTNMVFPSLAGDVRKSATEIVSLLNVEGIKISQTGERSFRLVTHAMITDVGVKRTINAFSKALG